MIVRQFFAVLLFAASSSFILNQQPEEGLASYYADKFVGKKTASGELYSHEKFTAAHKTLPFGTIIRVTNLTNQKQVEVKINDRGPFAKGRVVDLSLAAAKELDFIQKGLVKVRVEIVSKNP